MRKVLLLTIALVAIVTICSSATLLQMGRQPDGGLNGAYPMKEEELQPTIVIFSLTSSEVQAFVDEFGIQPRQIGQTMADNVVIDYENHDPLVASVPILEFAGGFPAGVNPDHIWVRQKADLVMLLQARRDASLAEQT